MIKLLTHIVLSKCPKLYTKRKFSYISWKLYLQGANLALVDTLYKHMFTLNTLSLFIGVLIPLQYIMDPRFDKCPKYMLGINLKSLTTKTIYIYNYFCSGLCKNWYVQNNTENRWMQCLDFKKVSKNSSMCRVKKKP